MDRRFLDLEALLRVPFVETDGGFSLSPDGRQVAFAWNRTGRWEIYRLPLDLSSDPQQISQGPGAKHAPHWSPEGSQIAYLLDLDGGEQYDLYVYDLTSERLINLTPQTSAAILPGYCWSPDGEQIALISDRSGRFEPYLLSRHGKISSQLPSLPHPAREVSWSTDGGWLAINTDARGQDYETYLVHHESGEVRTITEQGQPVCSRDARWSPDCQRVAFTSDLHGYFQIGLYELASGKITWLAQELGDRSAPVWSPDGKRLAFIHSQGASSYLACYHLEENRLSTYSMEPGVHYQPRFTADGKDLIFAFDNPRHPTELWRLDLETGRFQQLTFSLHSPMENLAFRLPKEITFPSYDGRLVPALLFQAFQSDGPPPAVLYIHGGPSWLTQITWDPLIQHMLSRGWTVLAPNYRGSTGYGRNWQQANRFDLGGEDTRDVAAGAEYLVRSGLADSSRIAITGRSYGGYLTMTCLTRFPDLWATGSAAVPFLNWFTGHTNSRHDLQHWDKENFGDPEKDYDLYRERSPYFFLDQVSAPVQLICGANDPRCPASESIQAYQALTALGKDCDLVLYPDEGHTFLKTENVVDSKKRCVEFLAKALDN